MQAEFFCEFFAAWDQHRDVIRAASLVRLNDISQADAEALAAPYQIPPAQKRAFEEYLRTLSLRQYGGSGTNKEAFTVLVEETSERGF